MTRKSPQSRHNTVTFMLSFLFLGMLVSFGLVVGFTAKNQTQTLTKAQTPPVSFPADHSSHPAFRSEWWYINVLTNSTLQNGTDEKNYANLISFSRINNGNGLLSSFAQLYGGSFHQKTDTGGTMRVALSNGLLNIRYTRGGVDLTLTELAPVNRKKRYTLKGTTAVGGRFDYIMTERTVPATGSTSPLLWGCTGKISVFSANDTYYYSIPDLDVMGTFVTPQGVTRIVKAGKAWIDHQWFNSTPPADWKGHYWTSSHWSTNQNIFDATTRHQALGFVTQVYTSGNKYTYWVRRRIDGKNECGTMGNMFVRSYSDNNGYPTGWNVQLKKTATSTFANIDMHATMDTEVFIPPVGQTFFEPGAQMLGTIDNTRMYGAGFLETHLKR